MNTYRTLPCGCEETIDADTGAAHSQFRCAEHIEAGKGIADVPSLSRPTLECQGDVAGEHEFESNQQLQGGRS